MYRYQLNRLMRGKARSLAPIIMGIRKFPSTAGIDGMQEEEDHDLAVHGEQLVVGVGLHQIAGRSQQLQADQQGEKSADEEEERDRHQIQQRNPLVVGGEQPGLDAVFLVQIIFAFGDDRCASHDYCTFDSCGVAAEAVFVVCPGCGVARDLM